MTEWRGLEEAVARREWTKVRALVRTAFTEWQAVRGFAEALTGSDAGDLDGVLVELRAAAEAEPVEPGRVEAAMVRLRSLLDPESR